ILQQLLRLRDQTPQAIIAFYKRFEQEGSVPRLNDISSWLHDTICQFPEVFIIVDAFDEYDEGGGERGVLFGQLQRLIECRNTHVLVTSRWLSSLEGMFEGSLWIEIRAADEDVVKYVKR